MMRFIELYNLIVDPLMVNLLLKKNILILSEVEHYTPENLVFEGEVKNLKKKLFLDIWTRLQITCLKTYKQRY